MISRFFIDRPIFAWVIAITVMLAGALAIRHLPLTRYPPVAPPAVSIFAYYPGADAQTLENSVTQIIEQQLTGLDGFLYMSARSDSTGRVNISVSFEPGTDPDVAQSQVQNRVQQGLRRLPQDVQNQGVTVRKAGVATDLLVTLYDTTGQMTPGDMADFLVSELQDPISRVSGVGEVQVIGGQYAMRIWLDPYKLRSYRMTPGDVQAAVLAQNAQVSAGQVGAQPAVPGQQLTAVIAAQSAFQTPEQFRQILLRANPDGSVVRLQDVARVEIGSENYNFSGRYNGYPASGVIVRLAPDANALRAIRTIKERVEAMRDQFPPGVQVAYPVDTTPFVEAAIHDVVKTLGEAIVLVVLVMFLFLQNWRATLIPAIAVPVVLLGTFGVLAVAGFTINMLTMFGMVLAIGLLVDDAIVVVENVERIMDEEGLDAREATRKSMDQITGALIGIALVLSAVFVPMAFFGGSTGVIYRQFSIAIVSAMALSVVVALTLTPALCATMLRRSDAHGPARGPLAAFHRFFAALTRRYGGAVDWIVRRPFRIGAIYLALAGLMGWFFVQTPTGFLPDEDQGIMFVFVQAPSGATAERTLRVMDQIEHHFLTNEPGAVDSIFTVVGFSFAGAGQNVGLGFVRMKDWSERPRPDQSVQATAGRAFGALSQIRDAFVFPIVPPSVIELGNVSGFDFYLQARGNQTHEELLAARNQMLGMAAQSPLIASLRPNGLEDAAQFALDVDWRKAGAMGVTAHDVAELLSTAWAGSYVNDFLDRGRIKKVFVQGEAEARRNPDDIERWRVTNATGGLVPFSNFADGLWRFGPQGLYRYNGVPAMQLQGQPVPGVTTGEAMAEIERLATQLPPGFDVAWTGLSLEERQTGGQAPLLYALSLAVVFLSLAALYESWVIPAAVMFAMPLGVLGALIGARLGGFANDVFFQVGLLTTIGLTGKNAILIVEFARARQEEGQELFAAISEAARQRFRPIVMTSMAFSLGVTPLVLSTGAGAAGRNAIGSAVLGGTFSATLLGVLFVPLFYVVIRRLAPLPPLPGAEPTPAT